jgi:putative oxidoreductase
MNTSTFTQLLIDLPAHWLDRLQPLLALGTRLYVSWQFLQSGWLKLTNWSTTLDLFKTEYHVPVLQPPLAAAVGTFGELFFPLLVILGIGGRVGPLGLFAVNLMAVVSYAHVLLSEGFEAAIGQHILWGFMLLVIAIYGNGPWSVDRLLRQRPVPRLLQQSA